MNIYEKLLEIQKNVKGLEKDKSTGDYKGSYKYVTGVKIINEIKPWMNDLGLLLKQETLKVTRTRVDYKDKYNKDKSEMLYDIDFKFTWVDAESGAIDENLFAGSGMNDWEKGLGSALTYAERYFLLKFFHIATDEDDVDNPDRKPIENPKKKAYSSNPKGIAKKGNTITPPTPMKADTKETVKPSEILEPITDKQKARVHILFKDSIANKENIYEFYKIKSCSELNTDDAEMLINQLVQIKADSIGKITQIQIGQMAVLLKQKGFKRAKLLEKHGLKKLDDMTCLKANEILVGLRKLSDKK